MQGAYNFWLWAIFSCCVPTITGEVATLLCGWQKLSLENHNLLWVGYISCAVATISYRGANMFAGLAPCFPSYFSQSSSPFHL